jgi:hypothetical protein
MNKATLKHMNQLEICLIPIKQPTPTFRKKGETCIYYGCPEYDDWVIKPNYIKVWEGDDSPCTVYKRIKNSCYWRIVGLKGYEFALIVRLGI